MTMRTHFSIPILLVVLFLASCSSPRKLVETGNYDDAIHTLVNRLSGKKKKKAEQVAALEVAFEKAMQQDLRRASALQQEGRADNWPIIHDIHERIRRRQEKVAPLIPLHDEDGRLAEFRFVRVDDLLRESRFKAADYYYQEGLALLDLADRGDRSAARQAYYSFQQVQKYDADFQEVGALSRKARELGISQVVVRLDNDTGTPLPPGFAEEMLHFGLGDLNGPWTRYHLQTLPSGLVPDYTVRIRLTEIAVSPEVWKERHYTDEKTIEDGWEYVLDENGNVLKDSLGNDVKTTRYAWVRADVVEVCQQKNLALNGWVDLYEGNSQTRLFTDRVGAEAFFEHYASTFRGDRRALSDDSRRRIGNQPIPFPPTASLLMQAATSLRPMIKHKLDHLEVS